MHLLLTHYTCVCLGRFLKDGDLGLGHTAAIFHYLCKKYNIGTDPSLADYAASLEAVEAGQALLAQLNHDQYGPGGRKASFEKVMTTAQHTPFTHREPQVII